MTLYDGPIPERPVRVLQFGEGNFLRAFADCMIDIANEAGVFDGNIVIAKPRRGSLPAAFAEQRYRYTVLLRGMENGCVQNRARVITSVADAVSCDDAPERFFAPARLETLRIVISNTTEAGIVSDLSDRFDGIPETFPGKLTKLLYLRFLAFDGDGNRGLTVLPTELIEHNGDTLKACVLALARAWGLGDAFAAWTERACVFCNTLVDRIVTGYPKGKGEDDIIFRELGYRDALLTVAEPYALWVIEDRGGVRETFPLDRAGLPVLFTDDLTPYRERKVRILNGAHTAGVLSAYLYGHEIVRDSMKDPVTDAFFRRAVTEEIVPHVKLPREETETFAASVFERFENPFIDHALLSIALNSVSKWKTRVLPSLRDHVRETGRLPRLLTFSFAALLAFYTSSDLRDGVLYGVRRNGDVYGIRDSAEVLAFFAEVSSLPAGAYVRAAASHAAFWGEDLTAYPGFAETVTADLISIRADIGAAIPSVLEETKNGN